MHTNVVTRPSSSEPKLSGPDELKSIALLLDVDGTILDTADTPGSVVVPESLRVLRDNLDENGATIWMRRGGRAERQLTMAAVLARL